MQPNDEFFQKVMTEIVETVEAVALRLDKRITALENSDDRLTVLDTIDIENPAPNTFAKHRGGLWRYTDGEWRVVANGIESVQIDETPTGAALVLEKSDGGRFHQNLTFAKN